MNIHKILELEGHSVSNLPIFFILSLRKWRLKERKMISQGHELNSESLKCFQVLNSAHS